MAEPLSLDNEGRRISDSERVITTPVPEQGAIPDAENDRLKDMAAVGEPAQVLGGAEYVGHSPASEEVGDVVVEPISVASDIKESPEVLRARLSELIAEGPPMTGDMEKFAADVLNFSQSE